MNAIMADAKVLRVENFVYGEFEGSDTFISSYNPSTGKVWAQIPDSTADVVDRAVFAAKNAFPRWAEMGYNKRAQYLMKVADLLEKRLDEFALAESKDQGKPLGLARTMDIPRAVFNLRCFAESWTHLVESSVLDNPVGTLNYSTRSPIGVAALIAPWNLPLYLLTFKVAPALMAGNTVVCKPSEMTTVTAWKLAKLFQEVNLPKGVFNLVCGYGSKVGESMVRHPDTKVISFTGSTGIGERIASIGAPMMKKMSLELGGKNAGIIFDDVDIEKVVPTLIRSSFLNQGEICLCTSRVFIQEGIFDQLVTRFVDVCRSLVVGDPLSSDTFIGALISKEHLLKVRRYINYALEDGGKILCGESVSQLRLPAHLRGGYFCQPTVIVGLGDETRCMQEEIFGPVVCLTPFKTEEEVIVRANNVRYGLGASVWSENAGRVLRVSNALEVGIVWANCWLMRNLDMPFGGMKHSGSGREGTRHSLEAFTEEKTICVKIK